MYSSALRDVMGGTRSSESNDSENPRSLKIDRTEVVARIRSRRPLGGLRPISTISVCKTAFENLAPIDVQSISYQPRPGTRNDQARSPISRSMLSITITLSGLL